MAYFWTVIQRCPAQVTWSLLMLPKARAGPCDSCRGESQDSHVMKVTYTFLLLSSQSHLASGGGEEALWLPSLAVEWTGEMPSHTVGGRWMGPKRSKKRGEGGLSPRLWVPPLNPSHSQRRITDFLAWNKHWTNQLKSRGHQDSRG